MTKKYDANIIFTDEHTLAGAEKLLKELGKGVVSVRRMFGLPESADKAENLPEAFQAFSEEAIEKSYAETSPEEQRLWRCFVVSFRTRKARDEAVENLQSGKKIESIEPDGEVGLFDFPAVPNDEHFGDLWGIQKINAGQVWDCSTGCGQVVSVIDTGIDVAHEDLEDQLWEYAPGIHGLNFNNGGVFNLTDLNSHGTHVAGTVAARGNNSVGVVGVAPSAKLMTMRIFGTSGATWSMAANAIYWSVFLKADVINCSWGGMTPFNPFVGAAIAFAMSAAHKPVIVAAAGNSNADAAGFYPASDPNVICVGATDTSDNKAGFSNWGTTLHVSAPGVGILSTMPGGGYATKSGTSMAAPHVAGMVALIRSKIEGLSQPTYRNIVQTYVAPVNSSVPMGTGRIDLTHLDEILCGCGCSPCQLNSALENRRLLDAKARKQFTVRPENFSNACLIHAEGGPAGGPSCTPLQLPELAPCFSLNWGDGPSDQFETNDSEIIYITACNPYCNVRFKGLKIQRITISPNQTLPSGEPSVELAASSMICYDDVGPSSCVTREYALLINHAVAGTYSFNIEYCIDEIELLDHNHGQDRFELEFVDS